MCCAQSLSRVRLFGIPWNVALQAPLSMGFSRQEYWRRLPFPSPSDLPNPGIEPGLLHCRQMLYHLSHQSRFDSGYRMLGAGALGRPRGMVWGGKWEGGSELGAQGLVPLRWGCALPSPNAPG